MAIVSLNGEVVQLYIGNVNFVLLKKNFVNNYEILRVLKNWVSTANELVYVSDTKPLRY
jgi:hypothetical protein